MSKEEGSEMKHKLESMEEKNDMLEVNMSYMPKSETGIPSATQDRQIPLEQFEDSLAENLDEAINEEW